MSGLFSSTQKSTSTSSTKVPQNYQNFLNMSLNRAAAAGDAPFVQYQGQRIADLSGNEQMGIQGAASNYGMYQPLVDMASLSSANLAEKAGRAPTGVELGAFINPYTDYVLGNSLDRLQEQSDTNMTKIGSSAAMSGAFGGLRHGVLEGANLAELLKSARDLSGTTYADAYDKGMGNWWKSQDSQRASIDTMLNTVGMGQKYNLNDTDQLMKTGLTERTRNQGLLDFNFGEFMREQEDPLTKASFMSSIAAQYPRDIFTKTTKSESTTTDSPIKTLAGIGIAAAGIMSGNPAAALSLGAGGGSLGSQDGVANPQTNYRSGKFNKGGQVKKYAEGGFLDDIRNWGANRDMDMVKAGLSIAGGGDPLEALDAYEQNQRYMQGYAKGGKVKSPAWQRKEGKNPEGGLNAKGRASYNRETGGNLKAPQPEGGSRRDSFCARMGGMKKKLTSSKTANDPDSRINKALRKWKCADGGLIGYAGGGRIGPESDEKRAKRIIASKLPKEEAEREYINSVFDDVTKPRSGSFDPLNGDNWGLNIPESDTGHYDIMRMLGSPRKERPYIGMQSTLRNEYPRYGEKLGDLSYIDADLQLIKNIEKQQDYVARKPLLKNNEKQKAIQASPIKLPSGNPMDAMLKNAKRVPMPEEPYEPVDVDGVPLPVTDAQFKELAAWDKAMMISKLLGTPGYTLADDPSLDPPVYIDDSQFKRVPNDPGYDTRGESYPGEFRSGRKKKYAEGGEVKGYSLGGMLFGAGFDAIFKKKEKAQPIDEGMDYDGMGFSPKGIEFAQNLARGRRERRGQQDPLATAMPVQQPFNWDRFNQARAMNGQLTNLTGGMQPNPAMGQRPDLSGYMTAMQNRMQPQQAFAGGGYVKKKDEPKSLGDLSDVLAGRKMRQIEPNKKEEPRSLKDLKDSLAKEQVKEQPWLEKLQDITWGKNHMERVRKNNAYQEGGDVFIDGGRSFKKTQDRVPAEMVDPLAALYHQMDSSAGKFRPDFENLGREDILNVSGEGTSSKRELQRQKLAETARSPQDIISALPMDPNADPLRVAKEVAPRRYTNSRMWDDVNEDLFVEGTKMNEQDNRSSVKDKNLSKNDADMTLKGTHAFTQFQYTPDTWNGIVKKIPKEIREQLNIRPVRKEDIYKYKSGDEELRQFLPSPEAAAYVYKNYYLPNSYNTLKKAGLPITEMNLYLAHHLGADGAVMAIPSLYENSDKPMRKVLKDVGLASAATSKGNPWTKNPSLTFDQYRADKEKAYNNLRSKYAGKTVEEMIAEEGPLAPNDPSRGGETIDGGTTTFNSVDVIGDEFIRGGRGFAGGGRIPTPRPKPTDTVLTPEEEKKFRIWKQHFAPQDSGEDYDLRGAFKEGIRPDRNGHFPDTYKKPWHPTFSNESKYYDIDPLSAGRWEGETFIPPSRKFAEGGPTTPNKVTVIDPLSAVVTVPTKPKRQRSDNVLRMPANRADWKAKESHWSDRLHEALFTPASDTWGDINDFIATTGNFGYTIGESNRGKVPTEYPIIMPIKQRPSVEQREPSVPKGVFSGPNFFDSASDDVAAYYDSLGSMVDADPLNAALAQGEPSAPMADAVGSGITGDARTIAQDEDEVMLKQMMRERIKAMQNDKGPEQPTLFGLNVNMDLVKLGLGMLASDKNFGGALGEAGMNLIQSKEQEALRKSKENSQKLQELLDLRYKNAMMESMDPEVKAELARQKAASDMRLEQLKHKAKLDEIQLQQSSILSKDITKKEIERIQAKIAEDEMLTESEKSMLWAHGIDYEQPIKAGSWYDLD